MNKGEPHEPHAYDPPPFPDECPEQEADVAACAEAIVRIFQHLTDGKPYTVRSKTAALSVLLRQMTVTQASRKFNVSTWTIYKHRAIWAQTFGMNEWNNHLRKS